MEQNVILGSKIKVNINIDTFDTFTMDDCDFVIHFYCLARTMVEVKKTSCIRIDSNNYIARLDTNDVGVGRLKCKLIVGVPDPDFDNGIRDDIAIIDTKINIVKDI